MTIAKNGPRMAKERILVVDDEQNARVALRTILSEEGYEIAEAADGEEALALLPGRFLVEEGDNDIEVRLVRTSSGDREEPTIGRDPGPPYRHIQLRASSVSAKHAKLVCENGGYTITNYSRTNPVVVNGQELPENASRRLMDADRVEIGEVVMTYRET